MLHPQVTVVEDAAQELVPKAKGKSKGREINFSLDISGNLGILDEFSESPARGAPRQQPGQQPQRSQSGGGGAASSRRGGY